jgi:SAM-dependent methyltransferase
MSNETDNGNEEYSSELNKLYENRFIGTENKDNQYKREALWKVLCNHFFSKYINPDDVVCDVAAGYCEFINNIKVRKKIAVDLNPSVREFAKSEVEVINDNVFNLKKYLVKGDVSCFFVSNFLEHLDSKKDVLNLIAELSDLLDKDGKIVILQPNIRLVGGAYWDFIDHKVELTEKSLIEAAEINNLSVDTCITRFLPYTTKSAIPKSSFLVYLYLKMMPLSSFFMGKQSFLVLRK